MEINTIDLPKMLQIKQEIKQPTIKDISKAIRFELNSLKIKNEIKSGQSVAITAGSRGIRHIDKILKAVVHFFKDFGAKPFIFPAMGSHGGGTADGQRKVLENYGITEESMKCDIKATMEVKIIGKTRLNTLVYLDSYAAEADHIFIVNRIKPHTKLTGKVESGLMKMCLIGMGKREGAREYHRAIAKFSWDAIVNSVTEVIFTQTPIIGSLAIIQNAYEDIAELKALKSLEIPKMEPELLIRAQQFMGKIPFPEIDLLIVDEMGKELSGTGMDTTITGRKEGSSMKVHRLFIRDLTEKTHGNAQGIGLADFTLRKLVDKIDFKATYLNSQTAYRTDTCKIPMTLENDYEVMSIAKKMAGVAENTSNFRIVWVKNTLELERIFVSEAFMPEIRKNPNLLIEKSQLEFYFNDQGKMYLK